MNEIDHEKIVRVLLHIIPSESLIIQANRFTVRRAAPVLRVLGFPNPPCRLMGPLTKVPTPTWMFSCGSQIAGADDLSS